MKETANVESSYLCHCLQITEARFAEILEAEGTPTYQLLKEKYGIGTVCTSCEYEAKGQLADYLLLKTGAPAPKATAVSLRERLGQAWGDVKRWAGQLRSPVPRQDYHTGLFFLRREGLETHLAVSNLRFPEHEQNINGRSATFRATLYGEDGQELAVSPPLAVRDGRSGEFTPEQLFPGLRGEITGGLYVQYEGLHATSSLRPYGLLVSTAAGVRARCHYHDKFGIVDDPGFYQNSSPCEPGQTCWLALANCQPRPYECEAVLKHGDQQYRASISVGPMGARWVKLSDLLPSVPAEVWQSGRGLFWLENPQHVMLYFFWYNEAARTWMGQHH